MQDTLPTYAKGIDEKVAATMNYGSFPTTLSATRLQRVADVMLQFGYIDEKIDIKQYIAESAA